MQTEKRNAATSAKVSGVKSKAGSFPTENTPKRQSNAMSLYAKPAHKAVARSIGYALTTGDAQGWAAHTAVLLLRLSDVERAALAYAALQSLHIDHEAPVIAAALDWELS